ncbi:MAG: hypothetical protein M3Y81_02365 [Chloroflexota bacterium]|nr:hypothetical protein [Chloroflexota bacterium]
MHSSHAVGWQFAIGCTCFLWLWGTAVYLLITGARMLSQVKSTQAQGLAISASQ